MRKIEKEMLAAVKAGRNWQSDNTRVESRHAENGGVETFVFLHGNKIYEVYENLSGCYERYFSLAGWNTNVTRSRLRALGVRVWQKDYTPMWDEKPIGSREWYEIIDPK